MDMSALVSSYHYTIDYSSSVCQCVETDIVYRHFKTAAMKMTVEMCEMVKNYDADVEFVEQFAK